MAFLGLFNRGDNSHSPQASKALALVRKVGGLPQPSSSSSGSNGSSGSVQSGGIQVAGGANVRSMSAIATMYTNLQNKLYAAPPKTITTISPSAWPSPLQPVAPMAREGSLPINWPFNMGQNLTYTPRSDAEYSSADLKDLSTYVLARACIENIKDIVSRCPWTFQPKQRPGETNAQRAQRGQGDDNLVQLSRFFEYPDGEHDWTDWLRLILEDMLVCDAPSILMSRYKDKIARLDWTNGADIVRYVDDQGRTPMAPSPAYAQLWQNIPRVNLDTNQLVYKPKNIVPRNTVSSFLYGMSAVECSADEIKVGALRLRSTLAFYEKGSVPGILHVVPAGVPKKDIQDTMAALNSQLAGQLEKRRQYQMIQGFHTRDTPGQDQILQLKDPLLADAFDEQHIRRICFLFGVSPQRLVKSLNRASAQSSQESSEEEGSYVWIETIENLINFIVQRKMGYTDYEINLQPKVETDPQKQAQTNQIMWTTGQATLNEILNASGKDPDPNEVSNKHGVMMGNAWVSMDNLTGEMPPAPGAMGSPSPNGKPSGSPASDMSNLLHGPNPSSVPAKPKLAPGQAQLQGQNGRAPKPSQAPKPQVSSGDEDDDESHAGASKVSKLGRLRRLGRLGKGRSRGDESAAAKEARGREEEPGVQVRSEGEAGGSRRRLYGRSRRRGLLRKYSADEKRDERGRWASGTSGSAGAPGSAGNVGSRSQSISVKLTRSERARISHRPSDRSVQALADRSEQRLSKELGLKRSGDNKPYDLYGVDKDGRNIGVEVKTLVHSGSRQKLTVHPSSLRLKQEEAERLSLKAYTVVIDKRDSYSESPHYLVANGVGSYHLWTMDKVESVDQLKAYLGL